ncbi:E3 UFM1-protein ligase [Chloropicon primus]|uniref:E3 UFM1-protein ligase n=3 Tax=Chloropicon primus TaxID=1764295 RepID=A0A5B8MUB5_9CHLO|nr:E3 UFM1-protein ligase [Chloropicon primus]UPR02248.1 E3 UFM1-protein ligase [Chloropicon primus]|eukprot:QDZ23030.1 E3 UFM1-protein ligase [Chloropicon primus]
MMMEDDGVSLEELMAQLSTAQETKTTARLSERNVVELVSKLKEKGLVGSQEDNALLHTVTGREYLTERRLREEVRGTVDRLGGRVALAELPPLLDVDIVHCEKAARLLAEGGGDGDIKLIDGELLTRKYFDDISVEINETLQQRGKVTIGEVAKTYDLSADLVTRTVESKIGSVIDGQIQSGLVYTPVYIARVRAIVRGVLRGSAAPLSLKSACARLKVHDVALNALIPNIVSSLIGASEVCGTYQKGSMIWTPTLYGKVQEESALSFFKSNGYVEYETLKKLGIQKPDKYLRERFPEGFSLESVFASAEVLPPLDAALDDCVSSGTYVDMTQHLPSPFSGGDVRDIVRLAPKVNQLVSSAVGVLLADTCFVSKAFCDKCKTAVKDGVLKRAQEIMEQKKAAKAKEGGAKGKKGRSAEAAPREEDSDDDDDWDTGKGKGKKGKKGKKGGKGAAKGKKSAGSSLPQRDQVGDDDASTLPSRGSIEEFLRVVDDELEYTGDDVTLLHALSSHFIHFAHSEHREALKQNLKADAEARRVRSEALSQSVIKRAHQLSVYSKSLWILIPKTEEEGDSDSEMNATHSQLDRHLVRTAVLPQVDDILKLSALQAFGIGQDLGDEVSELSKSTKSLTDKERLTVAKALPKDISKSAVELVGCIQKKGLEEAIIQVEDASSEFCGKRIPKLDKKLEQKTVKEYQNELLTSLNSNQVLTSTIAIAVPLIYARKKDCMLNLPGKLLSFALKQLSEVLEEDEYNLVEELHKKTVQFIQRSSRKGADADEVSGLELELGTLSSSVTDLVSKMCINE